MQHLQAFLPVKRAGGHAKYLEVIEYVGFNAGKAGFCRRRIVGFHGKRDVLVLHKPVISFTKLIFQHTRVLAAVLVLHKPVVPFGELIFQHTRVLAADRIESVVLHGNVNGFFRFLPLRPLIDKGKLHRYGSVKVVEEIALVNVLKGDTFGILLIRYPADTVRVHLQVGNGLLRGVGFPVALCLPYQGFNLFLFGAGQLSFSLCGGGCPRLCCLSF